LVATIAKRKRTSPSSPSPSVAKTGVSQSKSKAKKGGATSSESPPTKKKDKGKEEKVATSSSSTTTTTTTTSTTSNKTSGADAMGDNSKVWEVVENNKIENRVGALTTEAPLLFGAFPPSVMNKNKQIMFNISTQRPLEGKVAFAKYQGETGGLLLSILSL